MREFHHMISSVHGQRTHSSDKKCGLLWQSCWMPTSGICQSWRPLTDIIFADFVISWYLGYWPWSYSSRFSRPAISVLHSKNYSCVFICVYFSCVCVFLRAISFFFFKWCCACQISGHGSTSLLPGILKSHPYQDPIAHREWCLKHSSQEKGTNNRECLPNAIPNSAGPPLFALWNGLVLKVSIHNLTSQHGHSFLFNVLTYHSQVYISQSTSTIQYTKQRKRQKSTEFNILFQYLTCKAAANLETRDLTPCPLPLITIK